MAETVQLRKPVRLQWIRPVIRHDDNNRTKQSVLKKPMGQKKKER